MADQVMSLVASGTGAGIVENNGEWAPVFMFICPVDEHGNFGSVMIVTPQADANDLHYLASVITAMAEGRELHLDHEQMSEVLKPVFAKQQEHADEEGSIVQVMHGQQQQMGQEAARMARQIQEAETPPLPVVHCIVCGVRIFGDVAERGACLTCDPPLGKGEVRL